MIFLDYWAGLAPDAKRALAERLGTSVPYLSQLAHGHRKAGASLLFSIEAATDGRVAPCDLRPDLCRQPEAVVGCATGIHPETFGWFNEALRPALAPRHEALHVELIAPSRRDHVTAAERVRGTEATLRSLWWFVAALALAHVLAWGLL